MNTPSNASTSDYSAAKSDTSSGEKASTVFSRMKQNTPATTDTKPEASPQTTSPAPDKPVTSSKPAEPAASKPAAASKPIATGTNKAGYFRSSPNVTKGDYTIRRGDTLSAIAKAKGTTVNAIQSMNKGLTNVNKIAAGGQLNLPTAMKSSSSGTASTSAPAAPAPKTTSASYKPSSPSTDKNVSFFSAYGDNSRLSLGTVKTPSVVDRTNFNAGKKRFDTKSINFDYTRTGDSTKDAKNSLNFAGRDTTSDDSVASKAGASDYTPPKTSTTPSGMTGAQGGNPTPSGGGIAPDAGRQSTPTDSGSSISVKPEPSSTAPAPTPAPKTPDEKKGVNVESKLNEGVQVGNHKYRIV